MSQKFNVNYFIKKFEAIPESDWVAGTFGEPGGPRCAQGHCGAYMGNMPNEVLALNGLFSLLPSVRQSADSNGKFYHGLYFRCRPYAGSVNNGYVSNYQQETPKQRILAALYDIREATIKPIKISKPEEAIV